RSRLEYWLIDDDPVERVAGEFTLPHLQRLVEQCTGKRHKPPVTREDLARALLTHLGFSIPREPLGLSAARKTVEQAYSTSLMGSEDHCRGAVVSASQHLERVCRILIHFVCKVAFNSDAETYFRNTGGLDAGKTVRRASLGA